MLPIILKMGNADINEPSLKESIEIQRDIQKSLAVTGSMRHYYSERVTEETKPRSVNP